MELQVPHRGADRRGTRRTLTIASAPADPSGEVRVAVRTPQVRSTFEQALDTLPLGSSVRACTVGGSSTLPRRRDVPLVLVASGIGITPFVSHLLDEAALVTAGAVPRDVIVVDRLPSIDDVPYADVLAASGARVLLVAPDADPDAHGAGAPGVPAHWHLARQLAPEAEPCPEPQEPSGDRGR